MNTASLKKASLKPLALLAVLPLALTGCVSTANENTDPNGEVSLVKSGTLSVCTNTPYKPFEYEENGTIVGLDADIANAIASDLGVKAQLTSISFEGLDSGTGLATGQCDIALAGIGVTDERKSKMEFTTVYFDDNLAILVPKGSSITSAADLKGVSVGAQQATSGETYAKENGAEVIQYEDTSLMFSALKTRSGQGSRSEPLRGVRGADQRPGLLQDCLPGFREHRADCRSSFLQQQGAADQGKRHHRQAQGKRRTRQD